MTRATASGCGSTSSRKAERHPRDRYITHNAGREILPAAFYPQEDSDRLRSDMRTPRHSSSLLVLLVLAACSVKAGDHETTARPPDSGHIVLADSGMSLDQAV